jgi:hypothetical protein
MRLRRTLLTALLVGLAATTSAHAAVKKKPITYCNLIKDTTGDGHSSTYSFVKSPALDIQSGDIATGKGELVAVLRLGGTNTSGDNWVTVGGYGWVMSANAGGTSYLFEMERRSMFRGGGDHPAVTVGGTRLDDKVVTFKINGNNLEWHVKRSALTALNKKPGQVFSGFMAHSDFDGSTADTAEWASTTGYPDRGLSCVKAV